MLLMTSYPWQLTITELVSKCTRGMNKQLLKMSGAVVLSSRKKLRKTLWGGGIHPSPLVHPRVIKTVLNMIPPFNAEFALCLEVHSQ